MNSLIGVRPVAEWRFGTDVTDLRSVLTSLRNNRVSSQLIEKLDQGFATKTDDLQAVFDRNHFCSRYIALLRNLSPPSELL